MNVALTGHFEAFINQLVATGRYRSPDEVVRAGLQHLEESEGERFPEGSLLHLYTCEDNADEARLLSALPVPSPEEV